MLRERHISQILLKRKSSPKPLIDQDIAPSVLKK